MSEAKHTPAPWRYRPSGEYSFAMVVRGNEGGFSVKAVTEGRADADARLIAAAPELLAACEKAEVVLSKLDTLRHLDKSFGPLDELRAAIAKAKGGAA